MINWKGRCHHCYAAQRNTNLVFDISCAFKMIQLALKLLDMQGIAPHLVWITKYFRLATVSEAGEQWVGNHNEQHGGTSGDWTIHTWYIWFQILLAVLSSFFFCWFCHWGLYQQGRGGWVQGCAEHFYRWVQTKPFSTQCGLLCRGRVLDPESRGRAVAGKISFYLREGVRMNGLMNETRPVKLRVRWWDDWGRQKAFVIFKRWLDVTW